MVKAATDTIATADVSDRGNIRMHLTHIAKAFENGDFDIPTFVHETVPPGVPEMKKLREHIHHLFEETPNGGRVVISSTNKEALAAIHRFLRFQIEEHETGDRGAHRTVLPAFVFHAKVWTATRCRVTGILLRCSRRRYWNCINLGKQLEHLRFTRTSPVLRLTRS
jgi:hypothetical protein